MSNQDIAVAVLLSVLLVMSAFDATSKFAVYFGLFLLFLVMVSAWQNKSLENFVQALSMKLFPKAGG